MVECSFPPIAYTTWELVWTCGVSGLLIPPLASAWTNPLGIVIPTFLWFAKTLKICQVLNVQGCCLRAPEEECKCNYPAFVFSLLTLLHVYRGARKTFCQTIIPFSSPETLMSARAHFAAKQTSNIPQTKR